MAKTPLREERWKALHPEDRPLYMNLVGPQAPMQVEEKRRRTTAGTD